MITLLAWHSLLCRVYPCTFINAKYHMSVPFSCLSRLLIPVGVPDPWTLIDSRGKWLVQQCVLPTTQTTYKNGWRRRLRYASEMQFDPYLILPPPDWITSTPTFLIVAVLNYMFQLFFTDKLTASTIGVYLSALNYHFNCENFDTEWFQTFAITRPAPLSPCCADNAKTSVKSGVTFCSGSH
jgi:hypothetical protein